jgi:hypothetical protein
MINNMNAKRSLLQNISSEEDIAKLILADA